MKKVSFEVFGPGQYLYFNIARFMQLEEACKMSTGLIAQNELNFTVMTKAFSIGLAQHGRKNELWYAQRMQELLDEGDVTLEDFQVPLVKAIAGSGILGKAAYYSAFPEEMTEQSAKDVADEKNA